MSDLVRVRANGREFNVGRAHAEANNLDIIDTPPHRRDGTPRPVQRAGGRPMKPRATVPPFGGSAAREVPAQEAAPEPADDSDTEKE